MKIKPWTKDFRAMFNAMLYRFKEFTETEIGATIGKGLVGVTGTGTGIAVSTLSQVETFLRITSLTIGITIGVATLYSILKKKS